jgi:hypothetical protein
MNLFLEALVVGLALIPILWAVEKVLPGQGKWVQIFTAGAAFHLLAEVTGVNKAYVMSKLV